METERHFLLHCDLYNIVRDTAVNEIKNTYSNFDYLSDSDKLRILMSPTGNITQIVVNLVSGALQLRQDYITSNFT